MNKQKMIKILKIVSVIVWVILLMAPTLYGTFEVVTINDYEETYNIETDKHNFEIYCDKEVVEGTVTIGFYDEDNNLLSSIEVPFEKNEGKTVKVSVDDDDIHDEAVNYDIIEMEVKTPTLKTIEAVLYPIAIVYVIAMTAVLRINVATATVEGKEVEVYAGVFKKTLKVDGVVASKENKVFFTKPITLLAVLDNGTGIVAEIDVRHRISIYSQAAQKEESAQAIEPAETVFAEAETEPVDAKSETTENVESEQNQDAE